MSYTDTIIVNREGRNGYQHEIAVEVGLDLFGRFLARPVEDVPVRVLSRRYDPEGEWRCIGEVEFSASQQIRLTNDEIKRAMDAIRRAERSCTRMLKNFREKMAA